MNIDIFTCFENEIWLKKRKEPNQMPKVQKGHDRFVNIFIKLELCKMLQML